MAKVNFSGLFDHVQSGGHSLIGNPSFKTGLHRLLDRRQGTAQFQAKTNAVAGATAGTNNVVVTRTRIKARQENNEPSTGNIPIETITTVNRASTSADVTEVKNSINNRSEVSFVKNADGVDRTING